MNQGQHFDELTRALATNQLSRRKMLKSLAGVMFLGFSGTLGLGCSAGKKYTASMQQYTPGMQQYTKQYTSGTEQYTDPPSSSSPCPTCGACTVVNNDTASGTVKKTKCTGTTKCTAKLLCQKANKNAEYRQLQRYLKKEGFKAAGTPEAIVLREDGQLVREALGAYYTKSTLGQNAKFIYAREASGQTMAWAVVAEDNLVKYSLVFNTDGQITKGFPPPEEQLRSAPETGAKGTSSLVTRKAAAPKFDFVACKTRCKDLCELFVEDAFCGGVSTILCSPMIAGTPFAVAACAYAYSKACERIADCDKYCSEEACKCPSKNGGIPRPACGNKCMEPCQWCVGGRIEAVPCRPPYARRCTTCDSYSNECEEDPQKMCRGPSAAPGVCCAEGRECCRGVCCKPGVKCKDGECEGECPPERRCLYPPVGGVQRSYCCSEQAYCEHNNGSFDNCVCLTDHPGCVP